MSPRRRNYGRELWDRSRDFVRDEDELPTYEVGEWTIDKLYFLSNYVGQMTHAMVGNPTYSSINYIDLFASSGVCRTRDDGRRYAGSALLACLTPKPFDNLYFVEKDAIAMQALRARVARAAPSSRVHYLSGDCNLKVEELVKLIPAQSLILQRYK